MPYQNDMATLANIVGTGAAAQQAGIQDSQQNEELALKNQLSANQLPAESEKPGLMNLFTQAQTATQQGLSKQQNAKGDVDQALVPSDIALGQAKNESGTSAAKIQQYTQVGQIMNQAATFLEQVPEAARPAAMQQLTQQLGVDPSTLGNLMDGNPDNLRHAATQIIQGSQDFQTKQMQEQYAGERATDVAQIGSEGRVQAASQSAGARVQAAQIAAQSKQQLANMNQQFSQIVARIGTPQEQPGDKERAQTLKDTMQAISQLSAQTTQALVGQQQAPLNLNFGGDQGGGGGAASAPMNPTPLGGNAQFAAARAIWPNDDPNKYVYRTGPDGNLQRKLK